jgi:hypothetical protein
VSRRDLSRVPDPPSLRDPSRVPDFVSRDKKIRGERGERQENSTNRGKLEISGWRNRNFLGKNRKCQKKNECPGEEMKISGRKRKIQGGEGFFPEPFGLFPSWERYILEFPESQTLNPDR